MCELPSHPHRRLESEIHTLSRLKRENPQVVKRSIVRHRAPCHEPRQTCCSLTPSIRDRVAAATTQTAGTSSKDSTSVLSHHPSPLSQTRFRSSPPDRAEQKDHIAYRARAPPFAPSHPILRSISSQTRDRSTTLQHISAVQCSAVVRKQTPIMSTPAPPAPPAPRERTGACLCGRIKYRVVGDSRYDTFCHCIPCRKWTGSVAFTASICPKEVCEGECPREDEKKNKPNTTARTSNPTPNLFTK
jgi:hypothetical protein